MDNVEVHVDMVDADVGFELVAESVLPGGLGGRGDLRTVSAGQITTTNMNGKP
jgi:hypothetical protein